jgi:hypothetical protein
MGVSVRLGLSHDLCALACSICAVAVQGSQVSFAVELHGQVVATG